MYTFDAGRERQTAEKLREILESPEFRSGENLGVLDYIAGMLRNIVEWLNDQVERLREPLRNIPVNGQAIIPGNMTLLQLASVVLILVLLSAVAFFIFRNMRRSRRLLEKEDAELLASLRDPSDILERALSLCKSGEYRSAVRFLYISLLLSLNQLNLIHIDRAKTNRQYLKELRNASFGGYEAVELLTSVYDDCWYGGRNPDRESFDRWYEMYRNIFAAGSGTGSLNGGGRL